VGFVAYIWLFLISTTKLASMFTLRTLFPMLVYGIGHLYIAYVLYQYIIKREPLQILFPLGMAALGLLNLTYPYTATLEWFLPYGFAMGMVFRVIMSIGALRFMVYPLHSPEEMVPSKIESKPYVFGSYESVKSAYPDIFKENNTILITRRDPRVLRGEVDADEIVFWITRAREGWIETEPRIYAISPAKIDILVDLISKELQKGYNLVYMDTFEYLMVENGFEASAKFLLSLNDRVLKNDASLIVVMSLDALTQKQRAIIVREFEIIE